MEKVFGIPSSELAIAMTSLVVVMLIIISFGAIRRIILVKMGLRNIPRRKGQSILIVVGLMLSSAIIATSLGLGDTVRYSVRSVALDFLGPTDEIITGPGNQLVGEEYFDYSEFIKVETLAKNNPDIDGLLPLIEIEMPASNDELELAESNMRVRGIDGKYSDNFDKLENLQGETVSINSLANHQVYINAGASEILKIGKNDSITVYTPKGDSEFVISDVLKNGGLAGGGRSAYLLFELSSLQELLNKQGKITTISVSNTGVGEKSLELSENVTKFLRSELTNTTVALEIFNILKNNEIPNLLSEEAAVVRATDKDLAETLDQLSVNLTNGDFGDDFITDIGDYQIQLNILGVLDKAKLHEDIGKISMLSSSLKILTVDDQKSDSLKLAEAVASGVTTIFSIFGSFSIMVGMLLIFLVFVLLAAARSTELGIARAVGLKRRDLIQLFTYEGTVYALLATIVGIIVGIGLSFGLVYVLKDLIETNDFTITPHFSIVSLLIAFSSGLILTFITVVFSAYRASNLNIVVAIRGLKDEFVKKAPKTVRQRMLEFAWSLLFPIKQLSAIITEKDGKIKNFASLLISPILWPLNISTSLFRLFGQHSYLILGICSILLLIVGLQTKTGAGFFIGLTGSLLAFGLLIRFLCSRFIKNAETVNQIGGTLEGGLVLLVNSLPFDFFEPWTGKLSEPGPWFWPVGGAITTAAAVWLLMCNTKILIYLLNGILSRFSGLQAVTKIAISYPMAAKFRTGLTVAMFALIIFTLMIFSILNGIDDITSKQPERVTGGYDIKATISSDLPVAGDIRDSLNMSDFSNIAGSSDLVIEVKESEGSNNTYKMSRLVSFEDSFIESTQWEMAHFDPEYGATDEDIWKALVNNPELVIATANIIPSGDPFGPPNRSFKTSYLNSGDAKAMNAFPVEIRKRRSSLEPKKLMVIAVVESLASGRNWGGNSAGFYSNRSLMPEIAGQDIPLDTFYFSLEDNIAASDYAQKLERIFLANGMNAESLLDNLEEERATNNAFNKLFQAFSGLGLVVGIAAIGVLSVRAVVERRQSIGLLRAIGFKSSMIRIQFLIESSFITFLGIIVGIALGILQSWLIFLEISKEIEGASFIIPVGDIGILIAITIIASILASVIPANEASKIYPAEALRYE